MAAHLGPSSAPPVALSVLAMAKSFVARGPGGLLKNDAAKAKEYYEIQARLTKEMAAAAQPVLRQAAHT